MLKLVLISTVSSHCSTYCSAWSFTRIFNAQRRQFTIAELARRHGANLIELLGFLSIEEFKLSHCCNPPWLAGAPLPPFNPLWPYERRIRDWGSAKRAINRARDRARRRGRPPRAMSNWKWRGRCREQEAGRARAAYPALRTARTQPIRVSCRVTIRLPTCTTSPSGWVRRDAASQIIACSLGPLRPNSAARILYGSNHGNRG